MVSKASSNESTISTVKRGKSNENDYSGSGGMSDDKEKEALVIALMMRSYHLPGYTWMQDLVQYLTNNHPVIGICCHHRYHPVSFFERCLALIGSALFGLIVTNVIYLAFVFTDVSYDTAYVKVPATNFTANIAVVNMIEQNTPAALSITNGNIALWTIGSTIHALYDNMVWQLAACACSINCCRSSSSNTQGLTLLQKQERYKNTGTFLVMFSVIVVVALATFIVTLRKALDESATNFPNQTAFETIKNIRVYNQNPVETNTTNSTSLNNSTQQAVTLYAEIDSTQDLEFLVAYCIELALNYFIYYPIVGTIVFSGIVVCGKYETCGGRPYEIAHPHNYDDHDHDNDEDQQPQPKQHQYNNDDEEQQQQQMTDPSKMSIKQLKEQVQTLGLTNKATGFTEKHEYVQLLQQHRHSMS